MFTVVINCLTTASRSPLIVISAKSADAFSRFANLSVKSSKLFLISLVALAMEAIKKYRSQNLTAESCVVIINKLDFNISYKMVYNQTKNNKIGRGCVTP